MRRRRSAWRPIKPPSQRLILEAYAVLCSNTAQTLQGTHSAHTAQKTKKDHWKPTRGHHGL